MYNKMWRNIMTMSFMMKYLLANCQRTGSCSRTSKWDFMERKDGFIVYFHRVSFLTNKMLFLLLWLLFTVFWYLWAFNKWFCTDYAKKCENKWYWQIIFAAGGLHRVHQISKKACFRCHYDANSDYFILLFLQFRTNPPNSLWEKRLKRYNNIYKQEKNNHFFYLFVQLGCSCR